MFGPGSAKAIGYSESTQWVFSTALLQINVPNRLQGRVFAEGHKVDVS